MGVKKGGWRTENTAKNLERENVWFDEVEMNKTRSGISRRSVMQR